MSIRKKCFSNTENRLEGDSGALCLVNKPDTWGTGGQVRGC